MGPKGIFFSFLIVCSIYLWKKYRKSRNKNHSKLVNWALFFIAIYYGISILWLYFDIDN